MLGFWEIWAEAEGEGGGGEGLVFLTEAGMEGGAGVGDGGIGGIGGFALEQGGDGFLRPVRTAAGEAEVIPSTGLGGIELDGFFELGGGGGGGAE